MAELPVAAVLPRLAAWARTHRRALTLTAAALVVAMLVTVGLAHRFVRDSPRAVVGFTDDSPDAQVAAFSPDGQVVAVTYGGRRLSLWRVRDGKRVATLDTDTVGVAFSPDGRTMATGEDKGVQLRDATTGQPTRPLLDAGEVVQRVAFSPDGTVVAGVLLNSAMVWWDLATGQQRGRLKYYAHDVAFGPDGRSILADTAYEGVLGLYDLATGKPVAESRRFAGAPTQVGSAAFSPDGTLLAAGGFSDDGLTSGVFFWQTAGFRVRRGSLRTPDGERYGSGTYSLAFSPDGTMLATASIDGTVRLFDVRTRRQIGEPFTEDNGRTDWAIAVVFSPDGRTLAAVGGTNQGVRLFDVREHSPKRWWWL